jgi:predicted O-methyltransferase YrrM
MNPVLERILSTGTIRAEGGEELELRASIQPEEGEFLQRQIREIRPKVSLEVGMAYGVSSLYICEAMKEVGGQKHITIDPLQSSPPPGWHGIGMKHIREAGFGEMVEHYCEPSDVALPRLAAAGQRIEFALIDGWHTFDVVLLDFFYIDRMLKVGGVVVFDDVNHYQYPGIRKVCRYVATNRRYECLGGGGGAHLNWKGKVAHFGLTTLDSLKRGRLPEFRETYAHLGLPGLESNFMAFRKVADDVLDDGSNGSRRWDDHHDF